MKKDKDSEKVDLSNFDKRAIPALAVFFLLVFVGLSYFFYLKKVRDEKYSDEKITVATSIFPIYDIAANVIGENDRVEVKHIIPTETNPELYSLTDEDKETLNSSELIFLVGQNFDDEFIIGDTDKEVDLSDYVQLLKDETEQGAPPYGKVCSENGGKWIDQYLECENLEENICSENGGAFESCASACRHQESDDPCITVCVPVCKFPQDGESNVHEEVNQYYWLSIENAKTIAQVVYKELSEEKPQYKNQFYQNYTSYIQSLDETRQYLNEQSKLIDDKRVVVFNKNAEYFFQDLGFQTNEQLIGQGLDSVKQFSEDSSIRLFIKDEFYVNEEITSYLQERGGQVVAIKTIGGTGQELNYIDLLRMNIDWLKNSYEAMDDYSFRGKVYIGEFNLKSTRVNILKDSKVATQISLDDLPDSLSTTFSDFTWTSEDEFALETKVNPSYGELYFYEFENGELNYIKMYQGSSFKFSPSSEKVAYIGQIIHFTDFAPQDIRLMVDGTEYYSRKGEQFPDQTKLYEGIKWIDESTVQFQDWSNEGVIETIVAE